MGRLELVCERHRSLMRDWGLWKLIILNSLTLVYVIRLSRQWHYCNLLSQVTTNSARLVGRGNVDMNGFETWRLLSILFSLPQTAL